MLYFNELSEVMQINISEGENVTSQTKKFFVFPPFPPLDSTRAYLEIHFG